MRLELNSVGKPKAFRTSEGGALVSQKKSTTEMATTHQNGNQLVRVRGLVKHFPTDEGVLRAVDSITFDIFQGETLGLVGESGCGKSTAGRCILRLIEPTSGEVRFEDRDVATMNKGALRALRREMTAAGGMSEKEFNDAVLTHGPIPIEFIRAAMLGKSLARDSRAEWRFND